MINLRNLFQSNFYLAYAAASCSSFGLIGIVYKASSLKIFAAGMTIYLIINLVLEIGRSSTKDFVILGVWIASLYPFLAIGFNSDTDSVGFLGTTSGAMLSLPLAAVIVQRLSISSQLNLNLKKIALVSISSAIIFILTTEALATNHKQGYDLLEILMRNCLIPISFFQTFIALQKPNKINFIGLFTISLLILIYGLWGSSRTYTLIGAAYIISDIIFYPRKKVNFSTFWAKICIITAVLAIFFFNTSHLSGLGIISKSNTVKDNNNNIFNDSRTEVWRSALASQDTDMKILFGNGLRSYNFSGIGTRYTIEGRAIENQYRYGLIYTFGLYGLSFFSLLRIFRLHLKNTIASLAKDNLLIKSSVYLLSTIIFLQNSLSLADILIYAISIAGITSIDQIAILLNGIHEHYSYRPSLQHTR